MTGKEAIRVVAALPIKRVAQMRDDPTTSATERRVCEWRINEPVAFEELAVYASAVLEQSQAVTSVAKTALDKIVDDFTVDWLSIREYAVAVDRNQKGVKALLIQRAAKLGMALGRKMTPTGLKWRIVEKESPYATLGWSNVSSGTTVDCGAPASRDAVGPVRRTAAGEVGGDDGGDEADGPLAPSSGTSAPRESDRADGREVGAAHGFAGH